MSVWVRYPIWNVSWTYQISDSWLVKIIAESRQDENKWRWNSGFIAGLSTELLQQRLKTSKTSSSKLTSQPYIHATNTTINSTFFIRWQWVTRGHQWKLFLRHCCVRHSKHFFCERVIVRCQSLSTVSDDLHSVNTFQRLVVRCDLSCVLQILLSCAVNVSIRACNACISHSCMLFSFLFSLFTFSYMWLQVS